MKKIIIVLSFLLTSSLVLAQESRSLNDLMELLEDAAESSDQSALVFQPLEEFQNKSLCHTSYEEACLDPAANDYDCIGETGDGPSYTGRVRVVGPDVFNLDPDGDGIACD